MTDVIREEPSAPLYPVISDGESFRLQKINMILSELSAEVKHYDGVRKKYNKTRSVTHAIALSSGTLSALLTSSGIATSLTGPGILVGIPLSAIGGLCGIISAVATVATKKLTQKVSKHEKTTMLCKSKINTISDLISKALHNNRIDENEFALIMAESNKYEQLKNEIRQKSVEVFKKDDPELRKKIYSEAMQEIKQKLNH